MKISINTFYMIIRNLRILILFIYGNMILVTFRFRIHIFSHDILYFVPVRIEKNNILQNCKITAFNVHRYLP